jgi:hypothetical protein
MIYRSPILSDEPIFKNSSGDPDIVKRWNPFLK